jgi:hypothetical protein
VTGCDSSIHLLGPFWGLMGALVNTEMILSNLKRKFIGAWVTSSGERLNHRDRRSWLRRSCIRRYSIVNRIQSRLNKLIGNCYFVVYLSTALQEWRQTSISLYRKLGDLEVEFWCNLNISRWRPKSENWIVSVHKLWNRYELFKGDEKVKSRNIAIFDIRT